MPRVLHRAREAKVAELQGVVGVHQQVLRLDVAMDDFAAVAKLDGAAELEDVPREEGRGQ